MWEVGVDCTRVSRVVSTQCRRSGAHDPFGDAEVPIGDAEVPVGDAVGHGSRRSRRLGGANRSAAGST